MRRATQIRLLGALTLALAVPAALLLEYPQQVTAAIALTVVGLFLILVVATPAVPASGVNALLRGSTDALERVADQADARGGLVYAPAPAPEGEVTLIVSAANVATVTPATTPQRNPSVNAAPAGGDLRLVPPGAALLRRHEKALGRRARDAPVADLKLILGGLGRRYEMASSLQVEREAGETRIAFRPATVKPPCLDVPDGDPLPCTRVGCGVCQAFASAAAESAGCPLRVASAKRQGRTLHLTLAHEEVRER